MSSLKIVFDFMGLWKIFRKPYFMTPLKWVWKIRKINKHTTLIWLNNFVIGSHWTLAEVNKNQPLITINTVKIYRLEADTKVISMWQPYPVDHTISTSKQFHATTGCYINKTFLLCTIHWHKIHEQSIFPRSFISVFNSRINLPYLTDWGKLL